MYVEFKAWKQLGRTNGWSLSISCCFSPVILVNAARHWNYEEGHYQALAKVECLLGSARLQFTCRLPVPFLCFPSLQWLQMTPCLFLGRLTSHKKSAGNRPSRFLQSNLKIQTIKRSDLWSRRESGVSWSLPRKSSEVSKSQFPKAMKM